MENLIFTARPVNTGVVWISLRLTHRELLFFKGIKDQRQATAETVIRALIHYYKFQIIDKEDVYNGVELVYYLRPSLKAMIHQIRFQLTKEEATFITTISKNRGYRSSAHTLHAILDYYFACSRYPSVAQGVFE